MADPNSAQPPQAAQTPQPNAQAMPMANMMPQMMNLPAGFTPMMFPQQPGATRTISTKSQLSLLPILFEESYRQN